MYTKAAYYYRDTKLPIGIRNRLLECFTCQMLSVPNRSVWTAGMKVLMILVVEDLQRRAG